MATVSNAHVEFNQGVMQAIRYLYNTDIDEGTSQLCVASLRENPGGLQIKDFYCAPRNVENGFGVTVRAQEVKIRLLSPASGNFTVHVSVYDPAHKLKQLPFDGSFDGFPAGERE